VTPLRNHQAKVDPHLLLPTAIILTVSYITMYSTKMSAILVGSHPFGIAFDSTNGNLYVTSLNGRTVSVISGLTNTEVNRIGLGSTPEYIAFDSANNNLYVTTNFQSNAVSVISGQTNAVVGNPIDVGYFPAGIAFDSTNGNLYVANHGDAANRGNTVSVISGKTNTVIGTIPVGIKVLFN